MFKKLSIVALLLALANCNFTNNRSGPGVVYTSTKDALFVDNNVKPLKKGEACSTSVLSLASTGDSSVEAAKADAGITKIATMNVESFNVLIFGKACTVVRGE